MGSGGLQNGKIVFPKLFEPPHPQDWLNPVAPPLFFKVETFCIPPPLILLRLQTPVLELIQNYVAPLSV